MSDPRAAGASDNHAVRGSDAMMLDLRRQLSDLRRALGERQDATAFSVGCLPAHVETVLQGSAALAAVNTRLDTLAAQLDEALRRLDARESRPDRGDSRSDDEQGVSAASVV